MGVFERALQERYPANEEASFTPREAFAAIVVGAFNADGRVAPEEAMRVNEIFTATKLFRQSGAEPPAVLIDHITELFRTHGQEVVLQMAAGALPPELRATAFATAVDLVLADGAASMEERKFIDALQLILKIPDEEALKIVDVLLVKNSV